MFTLLLISSPPPPPHPSCPVIPHYSSLPLFTYTHTLPFHTNLRTCYSSPHPPPPPPPPSPSPTLPAHSYPILPYLSSPTLTLSPSIQTSCCTTNWDMHISRTNLCFVSILAGSGAVPLVVSANLSQSHVITERLHRKTTGSSHSTSVTSTPVKCLLMSVLILKAADWLKILAVTDSMLTCISMRGMEWIVLQRATPSTIDNSCLLSQMD